MRKVSLSTLGPIVALLVFMPSASALASTLTDFQARLALTALCLGQSEAQLRAQPLSSVTATVPEALASWLALVSENVSGLARTASAGAATDDQKKVMADGLNAVALTLHDHAALARNRGFEAAASALGALEAACRTAVQRL